MELDANWVCDIDSREVFITYFFYLYIGLWIFSGYLVTRRISRNDSLMGNLGPVIFFGFIIFFASFELLEWISREVCQITGIDDDEHSKPELTFRVIKLTGCLV